MWDVCLGISSYMQVAMLLVTQLDDLSPLYFILYSPIFPTSREHKNIVQFCTSGDLAAGSICQSGSPTTCW